MLVRFRRALDILVTNRSPRKASMVARRAKASKVARPRVPGMVDVDGHSPVAESLSTSSQSRKAASSVSKNGRVTIRKSSAQVHKTMEPKAKLNSLENTVMSAATRLLAAQKNKPKSERRDSTKIVEIINDEFKSTLNCLTVR